MLAALLILMASGTSVALAGAKPPDPYPPELEGLTVGIHKVTGEYCDLYAQDQKIRENCRPPQDCEDYPAGSTVCVGEGSKDDEDALRYEQGQLKRWRDKADHNAKNYEKLNTFLTECVEKQKKSFQLCLQEGEAKYPASWDLGDWVAGKISKMAADALEEAAVMLGNSVIWLLRQFADAFNEVSTIDLTKVGIGPALGITTGISVLVAAFLLLVQFGKVGVSQQGGPAATAIIGLAKWAAILSVYLLATQVALNWSDTLSTSLINYTFDGGGETEASASEAMKKRIGALFAGLTGAGAGAAAGGALITGSGVAPAAVGFVIIMSILCILAIGALWIEMLVRQAAIMILLVSMPIMLAGQMADSTRDWWPKARNALIAVILTKPVIVLVFSIGFSAMSTAQGVRNVIVGFIIFAIAATSWPVLAKFIVFTSNGDGNSAASGMISSVGSSVSSLFGGNQAAPSGAGTAGGGSGYTKALEADNANHGGGVGGGGGGGGGGFWSKAMKGGSGSFASKVGGSVGLGLQVAAVGKDIAEGAFANQAANAGLGPGSAGGRHTVVAPRQSSDPAPAPAAPAAPEPEKATTPRPRTEESPPPTPAAPSQFSSSQPDINPGS
ncbi:conjugal transfer protein TrbL family protein [Streptomyces sp. NPDC051211]|uniref:conjugal transfer protein TrbL family protein n=1 Tax=Streptomyces sp. NPDC051211 TaxID=3154643 RepID=UPI00344F9E88